MHSPFLMSASCVFFLLYFHTQAASKEPAPTPYCIQETGERIYRVSRACMEQHLSNLGPIANSIEVVPHFKDDQCQGLAIVSLDADSIFIKLGLQVGDILTEVNNSPLISPGPPTVVPYEPLKQPDHLDLKFLRNHKETTLRYEFE
jgi:type II secretory pathway component PulC